MMKKLLVFIFFTAISQIVMGDTDSVFVRGLVEAAKERAEHRVRYDGSYYSIAYPNGDIPSDIGVCTDVLIRSFRKVGIDLQKKVHEDMKANFNVYPKIWGLSSPDPNIDHRRVPNLMTYFSRKGHSKEISRQASDYQPGDVV